MSVSTSHRGAALVRIPACAGFRAVTVKVRQEYLVLEGESEFVGASGMLEGSRAVTERKTSCGQITGPTVLQTKEERRGAAEGWGQGGVHLLLLEDSAGRVSVPHGGVNPRKIAACRKQGRSRTIEEPGQCVAAEIMGKEAVEGWDSHRKQKLHG